jgi:hypothetical protein
LIVANGSKAAVNKAWRDSARLLLDRDGRDIGEAHQLIDWCQKDNFWAGNILSMPTFRRQYDKLRLQSQRGRHLQAVSGDSRWSGPYRNPTDDSVYDEPMFPGEQR